MPDEQELRNRIDFYERRQHVLRRLLVHAQAKQKEYANTLEVLGRMLEHAIAQRELGSQLEVDGVDVGDLIEAAMDSKPLMLPEETTDE